MKILISDRDNAARRLAAYRATHLVTFNLNDARPLRPRGVGAQNILCLNINKGHSATPDNLRPLFSFLQGLPADARLFLCCDSGVSRSATAALLALCALDRRTPPAAHYQLVRQHWPRVVPQRGMVRVGDELLGLGGELERCLQLDTVQRVDELAALELQPWGEPRAVDVPPGRTGFRRWLGRRLIEMARRL